MLTQRFINDLKEEIAYERDYRYQVPYQKSGYYEVLSDVISKALLENKKSNLGYFDWFLDLFQFHFEYFAFANTELKDEKQSIKHLNQSVSYGSILMLQAPPTCGRVKGENPFIISNKAVFITSMLLLTQEDKTFNVSTKYLLESLNGKNCIIKVGHKKATISWFLLKLFSLYSKKEITLHELLQPKLDKTYASVLEDWDTSDLSELEFNINLLCELHLAQATHDLADADISTDDIYEAKYRELFLPAMYSFPYEIITLLRLRELKGLENPKEYKHSLMNTPIAKLFLDLGKPLNKPKDLPYAKELLTKLKKKCPNIEIPEWV